MYMQALTVFFVLVLTSCLTLALDFIVWSVIKLFFGLEV